MDESKFRQNLESHLRAALSTESDHELLEFENGMSLVLSLGGTAHFQRQCRVPRMFDPENMSALEKLFLPITKIFSKTIDLVEKHEVICRRCSIPLSKSGLEGVVDLLTRVRGDWSKIEDDPVFRELLVDDENRLFEFYGEGLPNTAIPYNAVRLLEGLDFDEPEEVFLRRHLWHEVHSDNYFSERKEELIQDEDFLGKFEGFETAWGKIRETEEIKSRCNYLLTTFYETQSGEPINEIDSDEIQYKGSVISSDFAYYRDAPELVAFRPDFTDLKFVIGAYFGDEIFSEKSVDEFLEISKVI